MSRSENVWIVDDDRSIRWVLERPCNRKAWPRRASTAPTVCWPASPASSRT